MQICKAAAALLLACTFGCCAIALGQEEAVAEVANQTQFLYALKNESIGVIWVQVRSIRLKLQAWMAGHFLHACGVSR